MADPTKPEKHLCGLEKQQPEAGLTQAAELEHTCLLTNSPQHVATWLPFVAKKWANFESPSQKQKTDARRLPSISSRR